MPSPKAALRRLHEAGLAHPSRARGAYCLTGPSCNDIPFGDPLLVAHLLVNPESRMTMGPRMVPITERWVARSCSPHYCLPPDAAFDVRTARYMTYLPEWAILAYESGRPDGYEPPPQMQWASYPTLDPCAPMT